MSNEQMRAEFEAWAPVGGLNVMRNPEGDYIFSTTQTSWTAWQAALAARPPVDQVQALRDAVEGECEGLAISTATAAAILNHIGPVSQGSAVIAYLVDGNLEQGLFFDKQSAHAMAFANCGTVRPLALATHPQPAAAKDGDA